MIIYNKIIAHTTGIYSSITLNVKFIFITIILSIPWITFVLYQQNHHEFKSSQSLGFLFRLNEGTGVSTMCWNYMQSMPTLLGSCLTSNAILHSSDGHKKEIKFCEIKSDDEECNKITEIELI
ncbi:unnamed protein product [Oppiella nova]|uniref:Uncharacterized protein n=1 Tax=Oppiella nova TaxID=334625 RepID=A0A7R9MBU4_9ACAR|nr:unnamed protein product [Oppiella nova]CAG2173220.1 unnamed protein product [Oppiella nova]